MATISSLGVGSGLDLNGLLEQLEDAEREKLEPIVQQQSSYETKISAYGKLENSLEEFQAAAAELDDPGLFNSVDSRLTGDGMEASANQDATPGAYQIDVGQTARASSVATLGVAEKDQPLGAGTMTFTLGNGENFSVQVGAEDTLEDVRAAINDANGGVQASLVNDGSDTPHRLVLSSADTGTDAAIAEVDFGAGDLADSLSLDANTEIEARNAELTINGIGVESQSNTVQDAIQGVTLDLQSENASGTLTVSRDTAAIEEAVIGFVDAYNDLQAGMGELTHFDQESGEAGELLGDSTLRSVQSRLRSALSGGVADGDFRMLADLGIDLQRDGTLEVDEKALGDAVNGNLKGVSDFFTGGEDGDGLATMMDQSVGKMLGETGLIGNATSGLEQSMESLVSRYDRTEQQISATIERYRAQFSQLDGMISEMNSTSDYLTQQFASLNAQMGQ